VGIDFSTQIVRCPARCAQRATRKRPQALSRRPQRVMNAILRALENAKKLSPVWSPNQSAASEPVVPPRSFDRKCFATWPHAAGHPDGYQYFNPPAIISLRLQHFYSPRRIPTQSEKLAALPISARESNPWSSIQLPRVLSRCHFIGTDWGDFLAHMIPCRRIGLALGTDLLYRGLCVLLVTLP